MTTLLLKQSERYDQLIFPETSKLQATLDHLRTKQPTVVGGRIKLIQENRARILDILGDTERMMTAKTRDLVEAFQSIKEAGMKLVRAYQQVVK